MLDILITLASCRPIVAGHEEKSFLSHMRRHDVVYSGAEYHLRFGIYLAHLRHVRAFNSGNHSFTLSMNSLSTLTPAEYRGRLGTTSSGHLSVQPRPVRPIVTDTPDSFDWRDSGVVQVVKDQGSCTSGWAFAAAASAESVFAIFWGGAPSNLSEQNLIDCTMDCGGCVGGHVTKASSRVIDLQNGNFTTEDAYPYVGVDQDCYWGPAMAGGAWLDGYVVPWSLEDGMRGMIQEYGPLASAIDASHASFQLYSGGVYDEPDCSSDTFTHYVLNLGWGSDNGNDYWICKNSFGTGWGEKGYIRMSRNKDNQCGIISAPSAPLVVPPGKVLV
jgi:cathepsin L